MKIAIVVPTYNEADNLPPFIGELLAQPLEALHVFVVDDASPDGTGQVADRLAARTPDRITVIHRTGKRGLGLAYLEGFRRALEHGADAIVQMDADFSHAPIFVPRLVEGTREYDVVVGSRYVAKGRVDENWGWGRYLLSWWANVYARWILGLSTHDATAGFKCWRASALQALDLSRVRSNGYVFQVEMTYLSERLGLRILELPIYFEDRRIGQSKMSVPIKFEAAWRVWQVRWRHRHIRPLPQRLSSPPPG
ncbi:MAG: polyprenol monophosphomannose synthase [Thermoflexales bacterium]|nr:polyprenol monophosphomannose synthase [Thermoflexales bacterium]